ncbi:MAG: tRNA 2-thiouridine(34) synthase MnmA [bacterium]
MSRIRVVVGLSGGVDSSVSALLLKKAGYEVIGVSMKIWDGSARGLGKRHGCYGPEELEDIQDARRVCEILDIPFLEIDLVEEYKRIVLEYFRNEYLRGRTPNPCVRCNQMVKFKALLEKVESIGIDFDYFATGHYARVEYNQERARFILRKGIDERRDQSYFLFGLTQSQLSKILFPLGNYRKEQVREIAREAGLTVHDKEESQDFYGGDYRELLNVIPSSGPILDKYGRILGTHKGIWNYTIGQRKGLGIQSKEPLYVIDIDPDRNAIIVGEEKDLYRDEFFVSDTNWIAIERLESSIEAKVKIRYKSNETDCTIIPVTEDRVLVRFREPQRAVTPGQASVFYEGDTVIGGGIIED